MVSSHFPQLDLASLIGRVGQGLLSAHVAVFFLEAYLSAMSRKISLYLLQPPDFCLGRAYFLLGGMLQQRGIDPVAETRFEAVVLLEELNVIEVIAPELLLRDFVWDKCNTGIV